MTLLTLGTTLVILTVLAAAVLGWVADLRRGGRATSAWESRAQAERPAAFRTSDDRAEAMRARIRRERLRRERARSAAGEGASAQAAGAGEAGARPGASASGAGDRPRVPPPDAPEVRYRETLDLGPGPVSPEALRRQYLQLVAAYHPDRVSGLGPKLQALAEEETKRINEAYTFLKRRL